MIDLMPKNLTPTKQTKIDKDELKKKLQKEYDRDKEPVKGIFRFYELAGGSLSFNLRLYPQEKEVSRYDMVDGLAYTIPLGVAKHLNKNGWYPVHSFATDENGKPIAKIGQKVRRFGFESLEFIDTTDISEVGTPSLITVENV